MGSSLPLSPRRLITCENVSSLLNKTKNNKNTRAQQTGLKRKVLRGFETWERTYSDYLLPHLSSSFPGSLLPPTTLILSDGWTSSRPWSMTEHRPGPQCRVVLHTPCRYNVTQPEKVKGEGRFSQFHACICLSTHIRGVRWTFGDCLGTPARQGDVRNEIQGYKNTKIFLRQWH